MLLNSNSVTGELLEVRYHGPSSLPLLISPGSRCSCSVQLWRKRGWLHVTDHHCWKKKSVCRHVSTVVHLALCQLKLPIHRHESTPLILMFIMTPLEVVV